MRASRIYDFVDPNDSQAMAKRGVGKHGAGHPSSPSKARNKRKKITKVVSRNVRLRLLSEFMTLRRMEFSERAGADYLEQVLLHQTGGMMSVEDARRLVHGRTSIPQLLMEKARATKPKQVCSPRLC